MNSLKEVYQGVVQRDHEKVAAARAAQGLPPQVDLSQVDPELLKQAQDYDLTGRILAHHVMADLIKEALDEAGVADDKKDAMLADAMAAARGEKKDDKDKKDDGDKKDDDADKKDDEKKEEAEKMAAATRRILEKMAKDPTYVAQLAAKHKQGKGKQPAAKLPKR